MAAQDIHEGRGQLIEEKDRVVERLLQGGAQGEHQNPIGYRRGEALEHFEQLVDGPASRQRPTLIGRYAQTSEFGLGQRAGERITGW
jgi:hypothetical protein